MPKCAFGAQIFQKLQYCVEYAQMHIICAQMDALKVLKCKDFVPEC